MAITDPITKISDPLEQLKKWYEDAKKTSLLNPNAFMLSTVDQNGVPRSRVVLMKALRPEGIVFFTNYESQKGRNLAHDPRCSALFFWDQLFRQVFIIGQAEKTSRAESEDYWATRPRESQLSQWISKQSEQVTSRDQLENELRMARDKFANQTIPCPQHWGGYVIHPTYVEFWTGREGRLHDRITYQKVEDGWREARLYP